MTIDRALETYLQQGYSREWINQRLQAIQVRLDFFSFESSYDYRVYLYGMAKYTAVAKYSPQPALHRIRDCLFAAEQPLLGDKCKAQGIDMALIHGKDFARILVLPGAERQFQKL